MTEAAVPSPSPSPRPLVHWLLRRLRPFPPPVAPRTAEPLTNPTTGSCIKVVAVAVVVGRGARQRSIILRRKGANLRLGRLGRDQALAQAQALVAGRSRMPVGTMSVVGARARAWA